MARQTVCDQCGRPQPEGEPWWALTKFSSVIPQDNLSLDLCSDACLAAWSAARTTLS
jgi:hypothetical protein